MGLGNFLHKIGRGAAAARLSMHGYTPELLEKERALLRELYEEKQAERERKARADARAEEAAARAEQRAEEERQQRERASLLSTVKSLAAETGPFRAGGTLSSADEFGANFTAEEWEARGIKPADQDVARTMLIRSIQAQRDEDEAKREREKQEKAAAASEAEKTWLRHLNETDRRIRERRVPLTPKQAKDPDYVRAKEIVLATEDPDDPYTDPIALLDRIEKVVDELRKRRGSGAPTPEPNPFNPTLGYRPRAGSIFGRPGITSPGQPVGGGQAIDLGGGLTVRVRPR